MKKFLRDTGTTFKTYDIGRDFFEGDKKLRPPEGTSFIDWLASLVSDGVNPQKPMFLCVAAAGNCFNNHRNQLIDDGIKNPEDKNATSAFFIIAWPGSKTICYYAAGDGNEEIEKHFYKTKFLETDADNGTLVTKGTHHGAFNAFNADLFQQMRPHNYVVSAGREYGHPSKCFFGLPAHCNPPWTGADNSKAAALLVFFAIHKLK